MKIRSATLEYQGQVFTFTSKPVFGATGAWVLEDVTGWFGGVGVRAETTDRLGHGMFQQRAWRSNRALTLAATYIANDPDERLTLQRALSGMLWAGDYGTLTVETDRVLSCPVRLDGEPGIVENGTHGVTLQVPLMAPDPWLYSPERSVFLEPVGTGVGLEFPLFGGARVPQVQTYASAFDSLTPLFGGGAITPGGGAELSISSDWYVDGSTSLKIGRGTTKSSSAYILPRRTLLGSAAGRHVVLSGVVHLTEAQPDTADQVGVSNANPPRALNVGMESDLAGGAPTWAYVNSASSENTPGDHTVEVDFLLPDSGAGWFMRAFNGSMSTDVWWDAINMRVENTVKAPVVSSVVLGVSQAKVAQSFAIDDATGDYYVGHPETGSVDGSIRRVNSQGVELGAMFMRNSGHLNHLALERDGDDVWLWYWWPAHPNGAVRIKWRNGEVTPDSDGIEPLPTYGDMPVLYSLAADTVATYEDDGTFRNPKFHLWDKTDFLAGAAAPISTVDGPRVGQAYQGHAHDGDYLYMHAGGSRGDAVGIWRYPWGGDQATVVRTSVFPGESRMEAEGIAIRGEGPSRTLVFGMSTGAAYERVAHIVDTTFDVFNTDIPPATDRPSILRYGTATQQDTSVTNNGNATAYPTYVVIGDFPGGVSIAAGNKGGAIEYPWPIVAASPLRIEASGSAWVGDSNVTHRLTRRDFGAFAVPTGGTFKPSLRALQGGEGRVEIRVSDTWI